MRSGFLKKYFKNIGSVTLALAVSAGVAAGGFKGAVSAHADGAKKFTYDAIDPVDIRVNNPGQGDRKSVV